MFIRSFVFVLAVLVFATAAPRPGAAQSQPLPELNPGRALPAEPTSTQAAQAPVDSAEPPEGMWGRDGLIRRGLVRKTQTQATRVQPAPAPPALAPPAPAPPPGTRAMWGREGAFSRDPARPVRTQAAPAPPAPAPPAETRAMWGRDGGFPRDPARPVRTQTARVQADPASPAEAQAMWGRDGGVLRDPARPSWTQAAQAQPDPAPPSMEPAPAENEDDDDGGGSPFGPYISVFGGGTVLLDSRLDGLNGLDADLEYDTGFLAGLSAGFQPRDEIRIEAEFAYRRSDVERINVTSPGQTGFAAGDTDLSGHTDTLSIMANTWFDFPMASERFTPFIGGGVGVASVTLSDLEGKDNGLNLVDDTSTDFAWQLGAGVSMGVIDPLRIDVSYRYFSVYDLRFDFTNERVDVPVDAHNVFVSFRFGF